MLQLSKETRESIKEGSKDPNSELGKVFSLLFDSHGNEIIENRNLNFFNDHPEIEEKLEQIVPGFYKTLLSIAAVNDLEKVEKEYSKRLPYYIVFFTLVGMAINDYWGGVIGFILGYIIWNFFQPNKVIARILAKAKQE